MREIKFEYIYSNWKDFIKKSFTLDEISNWDCYEFMSDMPMYKDYKLLTYRQYTWLKDKNWVDIYEWDIVSWWKIVEWRWWAWWYSNIMYADKIEIIWNIYENPELLNNNQ